MLTNNLLSLNYTNNRRKYYDQLIYIFYNSYVLSRKTQKNKINDKIFTYGFAYLNAL